MSSRREHSSPSLFAVHVPFIFIVVRLGHWPPWAKAHRKSLTIISYKLLRQREGQKTGSGRGLWRMSRKTVDFLWIVFYSLEMLKPTIHRLTFSPGSLFQGENKKTKKAPGSHKSFAVFSSPRGVKLPSANSPWPVSKADSRLNYRLINIQHQLKN